MFAKVCLVLIQSIQFLEKPKTHGIKSVLVEEAQEEMLPWLLLDVSHLLLELI